MSANLYNVGEQVKIRPEWCDDPAERLFTFVIVGPDEGRGRVDISEIDDIRAHERGEKLIVPIETVDVGMIELCDGTPVWMLFECDGGARWVSVREDRTGEPCDFNGCGCGSTVRLAGRTRDRGTAARWFCRPVRQPVSQ